ncbi:MAG: hypothetical protein ABJA71_04545 [Ginsengibacter sp.]
MQEAEDLLTDELEITDTLKAYFSVTAKWAKFLSIIGLICCLGMLALAFYAAFYISPIMNNRYGFSLGRAISAVYIFLAVVWFFPCVFLYKFSVKLLDAIKRNIQENIESAFLNLRSTFKFMGIVTIIILALWVMSFFSMIAKSVQ